MKKLTKKQMKENVENLINNDLCFIRSVRGIKIQFTVIRTDMKDIPDKELKIISDSISSGLLSLGYSTSGTSKTEMVDMKIL